MPRLFNAIFSHRLHRNVKAAVQNRFWAISAIFASLLTPSLAHSSSLWVRIEGLRSSAGSVLVAVCTAQAFQGDRCGHQATVAAADASRPIQFPQIDPGAYAVKAFHDENGNGRLDSDWMGIPTEGYGLSNNPPKDRRPSFAASGFNVGPEPLTISVSLFYR